MVYPDLYHFLEGAAMPSPDTKIRIAWQSWFEVGHARIDAEHKAFFDIIKAIDDDVHRDASTMRILRSLNELALYTAFHFASEENLMEDAAYPALRSHRDLHQAILAEMNDFIRDIRLGIDRVGELVSFLFNWFCSHTVTEDTKFSKYVTTVTAGGA